MAPTSNKWYSSILTPQGVFAIVTVVSSICIFWFRTQESWDKIKELEGELENAALKSELRTLDDKVNRQYQVQREMNDKTNAEVEELKLWMQYHKGYEEARKDYQLKP